MSHMMYRKVYYYATPCASEPLGALVMSTWAGEMFMGVCIEKYRTQEGQFLTRTLWNDNQVHDFPRIAIEGAMEIAEDTPHSEIILEIYDASVPRDYISPNVIENADGGYTITYQVGPATEIVDIDDPLSMPLAMQCVDGVQVGMVISKITSYGIQGPVHKYRVIFNSGTGFLTTRDSVVAMNALYKDTPGLLPIAVIVSEGGGNSGDSLVDNFGVL